MKIIFLGSAASIHTSRWLNNFSQQFVDSEIILLSCHESKQNFSNRVKVIKLPFRPPYGYLLNFRKVKNIFKEFKPQMIHAFYATGYGFLARITFHRKIIISLWGSDILLFPKKSIFHYFLLKFILKGAKFLTSTSKCMIDEYKKMNLKKKIYHIPIGVNTNNFLKTKNKNEKIILGTIKSLDYIYGIDTLIKIYYEFTNRTHLDSELHIYGTGNELSKLSKLALDLGIADKVFFKGFIDTSLVPATLNKLDIFLAFSRSESFGVSVIEASSCCLPVVVSDVSGFRETVIDKKTGFIYNTDNIDEIVNILVDLSLNEDFRIRIGKNGRDYVKSTYSEDIMKINLFNFYNEII